MKTTLLSLCLLICAFTSQVNANTYTFSPTPANLNDLDHHSAYAWLLTGLSLGGGSLTSASITFSNIRNWDNTANKLFIHLLDAALATPTHTLINGVYPSILSSGGGSEVTTFIDAPLSQAPVTDINDDFAGSRYLTNPLVAGATTANCLLTTLTNLSMTATTITYTFTPAQLAILQAYILNGGNIAFGLDPDCHYFNNGISFKYSTPEGGTTAALLGLSLGALALARRKLYA
jgi:hypothetical protein